MRTYLDHWQLKSRPFEETCEEGFFFSGDHPREALERLLYLVRDGHLGYGLLTGEIGCGKTMVARTLQQRLQGFTCEVVHLPSTFENFADLLNVVLAGMAGKYGAKLSRHTTAQLTHYERLCRFQKLLQYRYTRLNRSLVIILDEAQRLTPQMLLELKNLSDLFQGNNGNLTLILCGQPELRIAIQSLPDIDQRIGLRYHLPPLTMTETGAYVRCRLQAAGAGLGIFSDAACEAIFLATGGIPRAINRVAKLALDMTFMNSLPRIEKMIIERIAADNSRQRVTV